MRCGHGGIAGVLRRAALLVPVVAAGFLSACSSDDAVTSFPPYNYGYLSQIHLNVATMQVIDHAAPGTVPGDKSADAPIPPDQALVQMANDRLVAAGQTGSGQFVVDSASILHEPGGSLAGKMDAHLDILSSTGQQLGVAEAHVTRDMKPDLTKGDADSRANLYELTRQMMQDMNVELEFQIRRNLKDWLVDAGGTATGAAIETQSLGGQQDNGTAAATTPATPSTSPTSSSGDVAASPSTPAPASTAAATATPADSTVSSEPDAIFPSGVPSDSSASTSSTTPVKKSPPTGYLKAPASAKPASTGY